MTRSGSNNSDGRGRGTGPYRFLQPGIALPPSQPTSSVATLTTTARGQFDSDTTVAPSPPPLQQPHTAVPDDRDTPDKVQPASRPAPSSTSALTRKPTPPNPNPNPQKPFVRSRSELTLLLERERARKGEGS